MLPACVGVGVFHRQMHLIIELATGRMIYAKSKK